MTLKEWFYRRRATRGYGVHSPLAFRIVKNVVRPPRDVRYYGEDRLLLSDASLREIRQARMLLRFVAEMQPVTIWAGSKLPDLFIDAIRLAGGVVRIYDGKLFPEAVADADMMVAYGSGVKKEVVRKFLKPGKSVIGFSQKPSFLKGILAAPGGGVVIDGVDGVIAVATGDPVRHIYRVSRF